ncbi:uncharacterized protein [Venturia canescens]|uniref:uncharacterized protein n=1 Tax=Venturia canescens TaxID=32260 RepID=UPI001C9BC608|nr:uncharacterized protein LOC122406788 [Venturia canescens]
MKLQPNLIKYFSNCFSCAVKQNEKNPRGVEAALKNVVPHAFGNHSNCGEWCDYKLMGEDYVHKYLPRGQPLSDTNLKESVSKLFDRFAANADKLAPCASSQANESFNSLVANKHPKSKFYAGSESFDYRVAAAVAQKNIGTKYVLEVNKLMDLSPGKETHKYRESKDRKRETQAKYRKSVEFKRKRLFATKKRSAKTMAISQREGITYQTESGFSNVSDILHDSYISENVDFERCSIVVFDLETTGLHKTAEICQIAACTKEASFDSYIIPSKGMSPGSTQVTGLRVLNGEMYLENTKLDTVPAKTAFTNFLNFLQSQDQPLILVAHNAFRFDAPRILQLAADLGLKDEFCSRVKGFADTLHIFKEKLPDRKLRKQKFSQEALATDFIHPSQIQEAHNAINDVQILQTLIDNIGVEKSLIDKHTRSVPCILKAGTTAKITASNKASLHKFTDISEHMKMKISKAGIDEALLKKAFKTGCDEGVRILLAEDVGGRPRVTKNKKIIEKIIQQLKIT